MIRFDIAPLPAEPPTPGTIWLIAAAAVILAAIAIVLIRLARQRKTSAQSTKKPD